MAYVEKIKVKGRTYYKLAHTIKKGNKVTHKTKYLGKQIPPHQRLEQLKTKFMQEITGQRYTYLSAKEVEQIEQKKKEYHQEIKQLSPQEKEKKLKEFIIRFTYDSSKLSGVQVTLRQTSLILQEGIIPQDLKSLKAVKELENHQKGMLVLTKYRGVLTTRFIKKLHGILLTGIDETIAGKTRDEILRNVKIAGTSYVPPPGPKLKKS